MSAAVIHPKYDAAVHYHLGSRGAKVPSAKVPSSPRKESKEGRGGTYRG